VARRRIEPRKKRTREHVIAAQAANYVERFIVHSGHACETVRNDYGYDLAMLTFDERGYVEEGLVYIQLKATDAPTFMAEGIAFDLDVRDYNLWVQEPMPVFLVVYEPTAERAFWLYVQDYFESDPSRRPAAEAKMVRVHLPDKNRVGMEFIRYARDRKDDVLRQVSRKVKHHG
jgi:Domain of unknown function (DUF4365)